MGFAIKKNKGILTIFYKNPNQLTND